MNIIIEDLYTPAYAIPLVAFSPRITGIFNPSYSYDEKEVIQVEDNIIEPSVYDEFARQTLWATSEAILSFRECKDKPRCESCVKSSGECVMVDPQLGYRCLPCLKKQILCRWRGDILVQAAIGEFDLTREESKVLYKRWWSSGGTDPDQDAEGEIDDDQQPVSARTTVATASAQDLDVTGQTKEINVQTPTAVQDDEVAGDRHKDQLVSENIVIGPDIVEQSKSKYITRSKRVSKPSVKVLAVMEFASASVGRKRKRTNNIRVSQAAQSTASSPSIPKSKEKGKEREQPTQEGRRKSVKREDEREEVLEEQAVTNEELKRRKESKKRARLESASTNANKKSKVVQNWSAQSEISGSRAERLRKLTLSASEREHELKTSEDLKLASATISFHSTPMASTNGQLSPPSRTVTIVLPPSAPRNQGLIPTAMVPYGSTPLEGIFPPIQISPPRTQLETTISQQWSGSSNNSKLPYRVISPGSNLKEEYDNLYSQYAQLQSEYAKCVETCNSKEKLVETLRKELAESKTKVQKANESRAALEIEVKEKARILVELEARHRQESLQRDNEKIQISSDLAKECEQLTRDNEEMQRRIQDMQHQIHYQHCHLYHQQHHYPQHLQLQQFQQPLVIEDPAMVISALIGMSNQRMMLQPGSQPPQQPLQVQQSQQAGPSGHSSSSAEIPPNIDPALFFPVFPPPQQPASVTHVASILSPGIATTVRPSSASGRHQASSRAQTPTQKK